MIFNIMKDVFYDCMHVLYKSHFVVPKKYVLYPDIYYINIFGCDKKLYLDM